MDAQRVHPLGGNRTDPPKGFDRQTFDELFRLRRMDGAKSVRLAVIGGDFGQKLIIRNSCRGDLMQLFPAFLFDCLGDIDSKRNVLLIFGYIQKRFVQ